MKGLDGGEDTTVGDMVASAEDMEGDAVERMQREQLCAVLWDCVDSLPGQQPAVLKMRFQKNMTLGAIGQEYGTTPEAVRQIHNKALRELRRMHLELLEKVRQEVATVATGRGLKGVKD